MNFEDIRPYNDDEYHQVITELFEIEPLMATIDNYLPEISLAQVKEMMLGYKTVQEFQSKMVCEFIDRIIQRSVTNFSYGGVSGLDKEESYLLKIEIQIKLACS